MQQLYLNKKNQNVSPNQIYDILIHNTISLFGHVIDS